MNSTFCTPQKKVVVPITAPGSSFRFVDQQHHHHGSFGSGSSGSSSSLRTPGSVKRSGRFHLLPLMNRTPISRLNPNRVIVNPFEASLTERLHLPMICSPSLFHRPATPQLSSTQFEWTIEDVASLGPANVEADETQFIMQTDPEIEARAQEAITSYFRENVVLPSPINCPLREAAAKMKLLPDGVTDLDLLDHKRGGESLSIPKSVKRIKVRDGICQTILTFPPCLPKHVEDLLAGFCTYTQEQQQEDHAQYASHNDSSNASLRRKLFETSLHSDDLGVSKHETDPDPHHHHHEQLMREVRPIGTPELNLEVKRRTRHFGSPSDNHLELSETKKESFGSLSPILSSTASTPAARVIERHHSSSTSSLYRSTPERLTQRSTSSNSVEMCSAKGSAMKVTPDVNESVGDVKDTTEKDTTSDESVEDDMQTSHWSDMTSRSMVPGLHQEEMQRTPVRRQNRSASRKNLSQSFSQIMNDDFGEDNVTVGNISEDLRRRMLPLIKAELIAEDGKVLGEEQQRPRYQMDQKRLYVRTLSAASDSIYRTDSGFNDDDLTSSSGLPLYSTPSKKDNRVTEDDVSMRSFSCD